MQDPFSNADRLAEALWGIFCPGAFFVLMSFLLGLFVFGPLRARAMWTPPNTRFRIADIIILLFQLQIVAGFLFAVTQFMEPASIPLRIGSVVLSWMLLTFWWYNGIRMLAKARVDRGSDRMLFLAVMLPLGYAAAVGIVISPILGLGALATLVGLVNRPDWDAAAALLGLTFVVVAIYASVFLVRWHCRRIVDHARDDVARGEGIAFEALHVQQPSARRGFPPMATDREVHILNDPPGD